MLTPLTPLTRSAALRFATLATLARSVHGLAHSLRSLPRGTVENLEYVFILLSRFTETNAFLALTRNTPLHREVDFSDADFAQHDSSAEHFNDSVESGNDQSVGADPTLGFDEHVDDVRFGGLLRNRYLGLDGAISRHEITSMTNS